MFILLYFLSTGRSNSSVPKRISYHHSFEKYIQNFLPSFLINDVKKFDLYVQNNAKYLFYRFNNYIKMSGGKGQTIKHTSKVKDSIGLKKIEKRDQQFLVDKIIHTVEFKNTYKNSIDKKAEIIDTEENNYRTIRRVYQQPLCWHSWHFLWVHSFFRSWWDTATWRRY